MAAFAVIPLLKVVAGGDLRFIDDGISALRAASAPIHPIIVWGKGRSGKSTFLNHMLITLSDQDLLTPEADSALRRAQGDGGTAFAARAGGDAVTHGIDILCIGRRNGGSWVLFDTEGVGNGEGVPRMLDAVLATGFAAGGTHVCVTADHLGDECLRAVGRVAVAGVVGAGVRFEAPLHAACLLAEGQQPSLDVLVNKADEVLAAPGAAQPYVARRFEDDADRGCNVAREVRCGRS